MRGDRGEGLRHLARTLADEIEGRQRRIHRDLVLRQPGDEILHRPGVEVHVGDALGRQVEAFQRASVGGVFHQEVQQHLIDVLDLVVAGVQRVLRTQEHGDVAAHAQIAAVRVGHGVAQDLFRERVVDLDLRVAIGRVPVHRFLRRGEIGHHETVARGHRAFAFQETRGHDGRRQRTAGALVGHQFLQARVVVAHVADRGHARGQVQTALPVVDVAVHVEQAGQQHAPAGIDDLIGGRAPLARIRDRHDAAVLDQQIGRRGDGRVFAVEHARVADQGRAAQRMRQPPLQIGQHLAFGVFLPRFQHVGVALPTLFDQLQITGEDESEEPRLGVHRGPDERGREAHAGDHHQLHLARLGTVDHVRLRDGAHAQRAAGDQRQLAVVSAGQRRQGGGHALRRAAQRPVGGARGRRLLAGVGGRLPARNAIFDRETLVHRSAERRLALHRIVREGAVGGEGVFLLQLGPAAVVLEQIVDPGDPVVAVDDDLMAGLLAAVDQRDVLDRLRRVRHAGRQRQRQHKAQETTAVHIHLPYISSVAPCCPRPGRDAAPARAEV